MKVYLVSDSILNREKGKNWCVMEFEFEKVEGKTYCIQATKNEVKKKQIQILLGQFKNSNFSFCTFPLAVLHKRQFSTVSKTLFPFLKMEKLIYPFMRVLWSDLLRRPNILTDA